MYTFGLTIHEIITAKLNYTAWLLKEEYYYGGPFMGKKNKYRTKLSFVRGRVHDYSYHMRDIKWKRSEGIKDCRDWDFDDYAGKWFPKFKNKESYLRFWIKRNAEIRDSIMDRLMDETGDRSFALSVINDIDEQIADYKKRLGYIKAGSTINPDTVVDLERVKQAVPIGDLMPVEPAVVGGNRNMYPCPLHKETKPSLVWYKDNNTWHCFGCGAGSSNIDLYMALNNCSFHEAAKALNSNI